MLAPPTSCGGILVIHLIWGLKVPDGIIGYRDRCPLERAFVFDQGAK